MAPTIYDVLNYPKRERNKALEALFNDLGVTLLPYGKKKIFGVPVLGKGWSSLVLYGLFNKRKVAVKVQRTDSHRQSLGKEASLLRIINAHGIGPTLYYEGEAFLILEFIEGSPIREAVVKKEHVLSFCEQCHNLDLLKIDHGQIQGGKHLIIGEKCCIIDFEKAGWRTPRNVSSLISELFLKKTSFACRMRSDFCVDEEEVIKATQKYNQNRDITLIINALHM